MTDTVREIDRMRDSLRSVLPVLNEDIETEFLRAYLKAKELAEATKDELEDTVRKMQDLEDDMDDLKFKKVTDELEDILTLLERGFQSGFTQDILDDIKWNYQSYMKHERNTLV